MGQAHDDLAALVSCQSVADPRQFPASECAKAAQLVIEKFTKAGLQEVRLEETPDGHPSVYGHIPAPDGAPTVLLYCHYDVQPPLDPSGTAWKSPVFELTERDGRWYGRGAADCKGNIVVHLTALRALAGDLPVGSQAHRRGLGGAGHGRSRAVRPRPRRAACAPMRSSSPTRATSRSGVPTLTTSLRGLANVVVSVSTLENAMHSGMFGGPAPDALLALIGMLSTLRDARGNTTIKGLPATRHGRASTTQPRSSAQTRTCSTASICSETEACRTCCGRARPSPCSGSTARRSSDRPPAVPPQARARVSLRVPPGIDAQEAQEALIAHLHAVTPWHAKVQIEPEAQGQPFTARTDGPAYAAMSHALEEAFGRPTTTEGQGGSIPLCNVLHDTFPDAEIMLLGVEEPRCLIHAPNESVDPKEIERMAVAEALFLAGYLAGH